MTVCEAFLSGVGEREEFIHWTTTPPFPEQNENSRKSSEQWREFHYDGMDPAYEYNRHST